MKNVIIISGPTAVGKTKLSIEIAKKLDSEIISADSMQIYKGMDIGTAKIKTEEMQGIKHHLIDIVNPNENYSVHDFQRMAYEIMDDLFSKGKIPIIVGGTGLYIDSLIYDYDFLSVKPDYQLREELDKIYQSNPQDLLYRLLKISPENYSHLSINDKKKIIRAIEVYEKSGKLISYQRKLYEGDIDYQLYVLTDNREDLYNRINSRVDLMLEMGLVNEVSDLLNSGVSDQAQSMKAIGYKEVVEHLKGNLDYEIMVDKLKQNSRHYAKRQLTWFRRNDKSQWIDISKINMDELVEDICKKARR